MAAGLDGIANKLPLPEPVNRNLFFGAAVGLESLPHSLREAVTVAAQSDFIAAELPLALQNKCLKLPDPALPRLRGIPDPPFGNAPMDFGDLTVYTKGAYPATTAF